MCFPYRGRYRMGGINLWMFFFGGAMVNDDLLLRNVTSQTLSSQLLIFFPIQTTDIWRCRLLRLPYDCLCFSSNDLWPEKVFPIRSIDIQVCLYIYGCTDDTHTEPIHITNFRRTVDVIRRAFSKHLNRFHCLIFSYCGRENVVYNCMRACS